MALAFFWTLAVATSAWLDLPRASNMPHDPAFLSKLSVEASAIVHGPSAAAAPVRGAPMWSDEPRLFRMSNGARLTLPATTTAERAAVVESEYRQILDAGASELRWPFLLERLAFWLASLLVAGCALGVFRGYPTFQRRIRAAFSRVRANSTTGMPV